MSAIKHEKHDMIPIDLHNFQMGAMLSGMPHDEYYQNGEMMAEMHIKMWEIFGHDVILNENGTAALAEAAGARIHYRKNDPPVAHEPLLKSIYLKNVVINESLVVK